MIGTISNWMLSGSDNIAYKQATVLSTTDTAKVDKLRFSENSLLVSLFEEACVPLMEATGNRFVKDSLNLQHNNSKAMRTPIYHPSYNLTAKHLGKLHFFETLLH